jgi:hypothetical protein
MKQVPVLPAALIFLCLPNSISKRWFPILNLVRAWSCLKLSIFKYGSKLKFCLNNRYVLSLFFWLPSLLHSENNGDTLLREALFVSKSLHENGKESWYSCVVKVLELMDLKSCNLLRKKNFLKQIVLPLIKYHHYFPNEPNMLSYPWYIFHVINFA